MLSVGVGACAILHDATPAGRNLQWERSPQQGAGSPVLVFYGAMGRHNFGDILMGHVLSKLVELHCSYSRAQFRFADVIGQDMRAYSGEDVIDIGSVTTYNATVDIIAVGGEIIGCSFACAANMILKGKTNLSRSVLTQRATAGLPASFREADSVYVPQRSWFRRAGAQSL